MSVVEGITLGIAVLGAILGVINTWAEISRGKIRLKVTPAHAMPIGNINKNICFCIEVTNLSVFPLTISDVGILYKNSKQTQSIINPLIIDDGSWPRRLEPRSSVTLFSERPVSYPEKKVKCAYAKTQCGVIVLGNSPGLKNFS